MEGLVQTSARLTAKGTFSLVRMPVPVVGDYHHYLISRIIVSMKRFNLIIGVVGSIIFGMTSIVYATNFVPANDSNIQYYGRWDMSNPLHPRYSWPGVFIEVKFTGTSIGIWTNDNFDYFNVYIDGKFQKVFQGDKPGESDYILAKDSDFF